MISVWGVDHGSTVSKSIGSALVHLPGEAPKGPPALEGKVRFHQGKRTSFGRTGPRKPPRENFVPKNPVADKRGLASGRVSWKKLALVGGGSGAAGAGVGAHQSHYNSKHRDRPIGRDTTGIANAAGGTAAVPHLISGNYAGVLGNASIAAGGAAAGYQAGRRAGDAYYKRKKR